MAAHRIKASTNNNISLPRCKSEGTLIDLSDGVSEASLTNVKVPSPSTLRLDATASFSTAREVVAIKDYCPSSFTTLKFSKGERLYVLDTSGGEWWYAHNNTEMGYIPAAYVEPINYRDSSFSDSGMIDTIADCNEEAAKEMDLLGEWEGVLLKQAIFQNSNPFTTSTNPFLNGGVQNTLDQNCNEKPVDLLRDNPFFRSKRSYSLSELSILQAQSDAPQGSTGDSQQISMKAVLDPPLELNSDRCTTVSPVVEIKLSNMETKTTISLEMKVSVVVKMESRQTTELWGKHQFVLARPQDLCVGVYSNMANYEVKASEQARVVRGFQVKLGKTPTPPPKTGPKTSVQRRFLKKKEVVKPIYFSGPDLTTTVLLEQILRPCKFLTYIYASVRTILMENIGNWRAFADALGYADWPLTHFCRAELDSEPERVASVLEKLKEDCNNAEGKDRKSFQKELLTALLRMDCQGLVARLVMDFVLLTTAVEVAGRWRELAERLAKVSRQQMEAYEAPHRAKNGVVDGEIGDSYRDVIQELHMGLDKMKNPITKRWKHLTGTLILVNCLDALRASAFSPASQDDYAI
ncbi:hypothetical protein NHX12_006641 [Muraenolepis orangiensis]|uniref:SH3 domain-containing protein n=1 Tax=Muraenolepis orangiensis TaxID=630683 RepID=A0A9Q0I8Z8_9TELE|nr:hypothetical protein NHX12_006641 [Muraenolepis orangiensis]